RLLTLREREARDTGGGAAGAERPSTRRYRADPDPIEPLRGLGRPGRRAAREQHESNECRSQVGAHAAPCRACARRARTSPRLASRPSTSVRGVGSGTAEAKPAPSWACAPVVGWTGSKNTKPPQPVATAGVAMHGVVVSVKPEPAGLSRIVFMKVNVSKTR